MLLKGRPVRQALTILAATSLVAVWLMDASAGAESMPTKGGSYIAVKHVRVLTATVEKASAVSFALTGVPATGVTAVVLSVSVTTPAASGSLIGYSYGAKRPSVVSLAFSAGRGATGLAVVERGSKGRAALYNASAASEHVTAVVVGYYAVAGGTAGPTAFSPVTAKRLALVLVKAKGSAAFVALGKAGVPVTDVAGVVVAVTTSSATAGAVSYSPYGGKAASLLPVAAARPTTSLVVLTPGTKGRILVKNKVKASVRVRVDVVGYLKVLHVPGVPTAVTATAQTRSALVSWRPPASNGGAPITRYVVTASPSGVTAVARGTDTSLLFSGLTAKTPSTFTVAAVNTRGSGPASAQSAAVSPYTVPATPRVTGAFTGISGQVLIFFTGPTDDGGSPITSFRATASPGGALVNVAVTPPTTGSPGSVTTATFDGLTGGTFYTFTLQAVNAAGASDASPASLPVPAGGTGRVSLATSGEQANNDSYDPSVTNDGRFIAFASFSSNLVPGDALGHEDVFLRDRLAGTTTVVSAAAGTSTVGNGDSFAPSISSDGRYVVFTSDATDLTVTASPAYLNVFVHDVQLNTTRLVSAAGGVPGNSASYGGVLSADASTVAFVSQATNLSSGNTATYKQIYAVNLASGAVTKVSVGTGPAEAHGDSTEPSISGDGSVVAFQSIADNLGGPHSSQQQIYERRLLKSTTGMISQVGGLTAGDHTSMDPRISTDGRYIAFSSDADNLSTGDTNAVTDVYLGGSGALRLISSAPDGTVSNSGAELSGISADGSTVVFSSRSSNLVTGVAPYYPQILMASWSDRTVRLVSRGADGSPGNAASTDPMLSGDLKHLVFLSYASNLAAGDTNGRLDVFTDDLGNS